MAWSPPEPDDDDEERIALAFAPLMAERIRALMPVTMSPRDCELLEAIARHDPKTLTADQRHWVRQLRWKYRHSLPEDQRPKLNPDDPIVRKLEIERV